LYGDYWEGTCEGGLYTREKEGSRRRRDVRVALPDWEKTRGRDASGTQKEKKFTTEVTECRRVNGELVCLGLTMVYISGIY